MEHLNRTNEISQNTLMPAIDIETAIISFQPDPLPLDGSVLEYWESVKDTENELYQLAMAIFSVPPTEVQIERDFSSLKYIFSDRRDNLKQSRLEDILLIHLNKDLFYKVNAEDLEALVQKHMEA